MSVTRAQFSVQGGGTVHRQGTALLDVTSLVTDYFTLNNAYAGAFNVNGSIGLNGNEDISGNLVVTGDVVVGGNVSLNTTLYVADNITGYNNLHISNVVSIGGNIIGNANLRIANNINIIGNANINGIIQLGNSTNTISGTSSGIGINVLSPIAILDISGTDATSINVFTTNNYNNSVLARNAKHNGIAVETTDLSSTILFFNGSTPIPSDPSILPIPDATIMYGSGNLDINTDTNRDTNRDINTNTNRDTNNYKFNREK